MASKQTLEKVYNILNEVIPNQVFYAVNVRDHVAVPFIVYQELSKRSGKYADDTYLYKVITIQITLVTNNKDLKLEHKLETILETNDIAYQMISEYHLTDTGLYRIYEIKMEEFKDEQ